MAQKEGGLMLLAVLDPMGKSSAIDLLRAAIIVYIFAYITLYSMGTF